jgi:light-regulated signal transduction histidine kinase (bacteriophytochrome)
MAAEGDVLKLPVSGATGVASAGTGASVIATVPNKRSRAVSDGMILVVITAIVLAVLVHFDAFDHFYAVMRSNEKWEIDGIVILAAVSSLAAMVFALRRSRESVRELERRVEAERALEARTILLERSNRELEQFAYVASHDLQEPLRSIQVFAGRLESTLSGTLDEHSRDDLTRLILAANRMQSLVRDLATLSRVSTTTQPPVVIDMRALLREILSDLEVRVTATGAYVDLDDVPAVLGDSLQVRQLMENLLANALEFVNPGVKPRIRVNGARTGPETVEIRVSDNGTGFDMQHIDRIFLPFHRLHGRSEYEGTGMGLAICQKIAERNGGSIRAESSPGAGSTFIVRLAAPRQNANAMG